MRRRLPRIGKGGEGQAGHEGAVTAYREGAAGCCCWLLLALVAAWGVSE